MTKKIFRVMHHDHEMAVKVLKTPDKYEELTVEEAKDIVEAHDKGATFSKMQETFIPHLRGFKKAKVSKAQEKRHTTRLVDRLASISLYANSALRQIDQRNASNWLEAVENMTEVVRQAKNLEHLMDLD